MKPHSSSLFHFTKNKTTFKSILEKGLRYSFSFEAFPDAIIDSMLCSGLFPLLPEFENNNFNKGFAIPMISFCDIPLTRVHAHSIRYGKYAIGISKDFICDVYSEFLNPVFYAESKKVLDAIRHLSIAQGVALKSLCAQIQSNDKYDLDCILKQSSANTESALNRLNTLPSELKDLYDHIINLRISITTLISLIKPTYGVNVEGVKQCFYDEHEWRAIFPNIPESVFQWQVGIDRDEFKSFRDNLNSSLDSEEDAFITLPGDWVNQITHIIVPKEKDVQSISNFIISNDKILGYSDFEAYQRGHLLSKITSFERIENDY